MIDGAIAKVVAEGGERITGINGTTRYRVMGIVRETVASGMAQGLPIGEITRQIEENLGNSPVFDRARSELIARTETMMAYNSAALTSYKGYGVEKVQAMDGDADEACAARNLQVFTVLEAQVIQDHPNGTLAWVPLIGPERGRDFGPKVPKNLGGTDRIRTAPPPPPARITPPVRRIPLDPEAPRPNYVPSMGQTKPVGDAFQQSLADLRGSKLRWADPEAKQVAMKIDDALATIDRHMVDGVLPDMPEVGPLKNMSQSVLGAYRHILTRPISLEFRGRTSLNTVFHEITHFIDHLGLGVRGEFGSRLGFAAVRGELDDFIRAKGFGPEAAADLRFRAELMRPVAQAITDSRGYQSLYEALTSRYVEVPATEYVNGPIFWRTARLSPEQIQWLEYALDPEEVFARAMAQYLTRRQGGAALAEFTDSLTVTGTGRATPLADDWLWDDFAPIESAIEQMLRSAGWRP